MNLLIVFTIKGQMQLQVRIKDETRASPVVPATARVYRSRVQAWWKWENKAEQHLTFVANHGEKSFLVSSPRRVLSHPLQGVVSHGELQSARRSRTRGASQDRTEGFSVSKIRGAPQLNVPTEWALPHLTPRRFTPPPTSPPARFPPLCLHCMGMPTPVGWRCSLYRPHHLSLPLPDPLSHSLSLTHSRICKNTVKVDADSVWKMWSAESQVFPTFDENLRNTSEP